MAAQPIPVEVFCSYAHEDEAWLHKLEAHLSLLKQQGLISFWHDRLITPGTDWAQTIDTHLETASIILLLISANFFASDYCYGIEMKRALERHQANEARVIPLLIRPVDWTDAPFGHLQALPTGAKPLTTWSNIDTALTDIAAYIRRVVEELPQLSANAPRAALPAIWNIPYSRNPFFLGRDEELSQLRRLLCSGQATALSQPQAISGLGGIGKTQLVLEYAYRFFQEYQAVLWARADSIDALISSYVAIATLLHLPELKAKEQVVIVQAVKTWLQIHGDWLLILDNADELALLPDFLPPILGGHLLLTTRATATGRLAYRMEIETLTPEQGALLLLRRAGLIAPDAPFEQVAQREWERAVQLSQELGGLPLALDQAGAYLEETGLDLAGYAQLYQQYRATLLHERRGLVADHPAPVATTWSLSFQRIQEKNPVAAQLLRMIAFLSPDAIPEELFTDSASTLDPILAPITRDSLLFNQALEALRAYSLIRRNPIVKMLSVHRLVQAVLQETMKEEEQRYRAEQVMLMINATFPEDKHELWPQCERLLTQSLIGAQWIERYHFISEEAAHLLRGTAFYLQDHGRYREAEPLLQWYLRIWEQHLGPEHPDVANRLYRLADIYTEQGKYTEAESLYQRALRIWEQYLGPGHPNVAFPLMGLADIYTEQGKYAEAESLYQRALHILEQSRGPEHPNVASPLMGLANIYTKQGKYAEVEPLYQRALAISEQSLGSESTLAAFSLVGLADLYTEQGKYPEAESLYQRASRIWEKIRSLEHPYMASPLMGLANIYTKQRKYAEAESLYQRALHILEQSRGPEHPYIAFPFRGLADIEANQGKYAEAESHYQQALHLLEQSLGPEHPDVAKILYDLAAFQQMRGNHQEALSLYQRALVIREQVFGPEHPKVSITHQRFTTLRHLASQESVALSEQHSVGTE